VMMQEQVVQRKGYNISHIGSRLVRGGRTITAIRKDTHLEFTEVEMAGEGNLQVFNVVYPTGRKMRLVNVCIELSQVEGVRSQGRPAQTARLEEIMRQKKILIGGGWNAHSDRWDPQFQPRRDAVFLENLMDEYDLVDVTDGEATHVSKRGGEESHSHIHCFITTASMSDGLEIATDLETTSDQAILWAHLRWNKGEGAKGSRKIT